MFYLNELVFRLKSFCFSFVLVILLCYFYKESLLVLFSISLLNTFVDSFNEFNNFIYTHPIELFQVYLYTTLLIASFGIIPYFFWHLLDFLKSSLTKIKYKTIRGFTVKILSLILLINLFSFLYFLPFLWIFFKNFNFDPTLPKSLNFFFELRVQEYFNFVLEFLYLINTLILLFIALLSISYYFGIANIINWKKLIIFLNIMIATFLSPPDVSSQLLIFCFLHLSFEILIFLALYKLKLNSLYERS